MQDAPPVEDAPVQDAPEAEDSPVQDDAPEEPMPTELIPTEQPLVQFNDRQVDVLRNTVAHDLNEFEFDAFLWQCKRLQLDPFAKQIYAWKDNGRVVTMTSIDGLRVIRDRTGLFAGQIGPQWCAADGKWIDSVGPDGGPAAWLSNDPPAAARFAVKRRDTEEPFWAVATFNQYGRAKGVWRTAGGAANMLSKCAEALALRSAFPADLSGVYTDDEIDTARNLVNADSGSDQMPGAGDRRVEATIAKFEALPEDARDALEKWWAAKYVVSVLKSRIDKVGMLRSGAIRRFAPDSPHVDKLSELIDKAMQATKTEPFDVDTDRVIADQDAAAEQRAFTDGESFVMSSLQELGGGTVAQIAAQLGVTEADSLRVVVQQLFTDGVLELEPDAEGPPFYRIKP